MALKKSFTVTGEGYVSDRNMTVKTGEQTVSTGDLYVKVNSVQADKTTVKATVDFLNLDKVGLVMSKSYEFLAEMNGSNFIAQTYEHLKTLPEFAGSTDV